MNLFEAVKDSVTVRQAAERYGIKIHRNGMALCPFHDDHHPSMKTDRRFHCFGCQADGDVIDFVGRLFQLSVLEAARKLATDFSVGYENHNGHIRNQIKPRLSEEQRFRQTENRCFHVLADYRHLLAQWRKDFAPQPTDKEWHPLFTEALQKQQEVEEMLDVLLIGSLKNKAEIIIELGKEIPRLEQRVSAFARRAAAGRDEHRRSHRAEPER